MRDLTLAACSVLLAVSASTTLGPEFIRLTIGKGWAGANDLRVLYEDSREFVGGRPASPDPVRRVIPPAGHPVVYAFVGWLPWSVARLVWAMTQALALLVVIRTLLLSRGSRGLAATCCAVLLALGSTAVGTTIGNGQLGLHILVLVLVGIALSRREAPTLATDLLAATALALALIKPNIALPFLWLAVIGPFQIRVRPLAFTAILFGGLSLLAAQFQQGELVRVHEEWLRRGSFVAVHWGYGNLHRALGSLGWKALILPVATAGLLYGAVVLRYRRIEPWILIGLTALFSRLWAYHQLYDDVLTLLAMVWLLRTASAPGRPFALGLFAANALVLVLPSAWAFEKPLQVLYESSHVAVWIADLAFLVFEAERGRRGHLDAGTSNVRDAQKLSQSAPLSLGAATM